MGCDIHVVIEEKTELGWMPVWFGSPIKVRKSVENTVGYARPQITERNYTFFAALAGVRGNGPYAKGFPWDANHATLHWLEKHAGEHSASWWPIKDFVSLYIKALAAYDDISIGSPNVEPPKYPCSEYFYLDRADENPERFRVLFNFDS